MGGPAEASTNIRGPAGHGGNEQMTEFVLASISLGVLTVFALYSPFAVSRLWSGKAKLPESPPAWWTFGAVAWRGYLRAMPITAALGAPALALTFWCFMLLTSAGGHPFVAYPTVTNLLRIGFIVGAVIDLVAFTSGLLVFMFNKPSRLVAPHHRSQHGALKEWFPGR